MSVWTSVCPSTYAGIVWKTTEYIVIIFSIPGIPMIQVVFFPYARKVAKFPTGSIATYLINYIYCFLPRNVSA